MLHRSKVAPIINLKSVPAYRAIAVPLKQEVASGTVFASKMAFLSKTKGASVASPVPWVPHQTQLNQGPLPPRRRRWLPTNCANEPPPKLLPASETKHFVHTASGITRPLARRKLLDLGPLTTPQPPLILSLPPPLVPCLSKTVVPSETVAGSVARL